MGLLLIYFHVTLPSELTVGIGSTFFGYLGIYRVEIKVTATYDWLYWNLYTFQI